MKIKAIIDYFILTIGSIIVAAGLELILSPNELVDGGITALSIYAFTLWGIPIWLALLAMNLPTLFISAKYMGRTFVVRTLYANIVTGLALYWMAPMPAITSSEVLIVLYGGLLLGTGVGLVVKVGGAIDGTEMIAIWINKKYHISISSFLLAINAVILCGAIYVFQSIEKAMFSFAVFYIVSKMIDFVLDGLNQAKSVTIISDKPEEIGEALMEELEAQITYMYGKGGYTGEDRKLIYCITNRFMYPKLKDLVLTIDPTAVIEASFVAETAGIKSKAPLSFHEEPTATEEPTPKIEPPAKEELLIAAPKQDSKEKTSIDEMQHAASEANHTSTPAAANTEDSTSSNKLNHSNNTKR